MATAYQLRQSPSLPLLICLIALATNLPLAASSKESDAQWETWFKSPPSRASQLAEDLASRATKTAQSVADSKYTGNFDLVISGGGNLDGYAMGFHMVASRVKALNLKRSAGASAGGMLPFEIALRGETATLASHLSYGMIEETFPGEFSNALFAGLNQDHHWRLYARWLVDTYVSDFASKLDDEVYVALSCLDWLPKQVIVSNYTSTDQAFAAFMGTGTFFQWYDGMPCTDGGGMSGADMTPLFTDGVRDQLIVNLMDTGFPLSMVSIYNSTSYNSLVQRGIDEAGEFFTQGSVTRDPKVITSCPKDSNTKSGVCK